MFGLGFLDIAIIVLRIRNIEIPMLSAIIANLKLKPLIIFRSLLPTTSL